MMAVHPGAGAHSNDNKNPNTKEYPMMMNTTLEQLRDLKLAGMATSLQEQRKRSFIYALSPQRELRDACVHVEQRGHMRCRGTQRY